MKHARTLLEAGRHDPGETAAPSPRPSPGGRGSRDETVFAVRFSFRGSGRRDSGASGRSRSCSSGWERWERRRRSRRRGRASGGSRSWTATSSRNRTSRGSSSSTRDDAARVVPKAAAAARRLLEIAPGLEVRGVVADLDQRNAREILAGHALVFDGSDNFETRLLVSDAARALGIPSIYAACVGEEGLVAASLPGAPCLRCYLEVLPPAGSGPTCDTAGVVPTLPPLVAAAAMTEALRLAVGETPRGGFLVAPGLGGGFVCAAGLRERPPVAAPARSARAGAFRPSRGREPRRS